MGLAERDVRLALDIVEAAASTQNGTPFGTELLDALLRAIPAESAEYSEWPFHEEMSVHLSSPFDLWSEQSEKDGWEIMAVACKSYPLRDVEHATSTEPYRISDFASQRTFRGTPFYALMMRPFGAEHELKLWLPAPPRQSRNVSLVRGPGKDFTERDLALVRLVRPYLARIRARWSPRPAQLTVRERDVVELLAQGSRTARSGGGCSSPRERCASTWSTSTRSSESGRAPAPSRPRSAPARREEPEARPEPGPGSGRRDPPLVVDPPRTVVARPTRLQRRLS